MPKLFAALLVSGCLAAAAAPAANEPSITLAEGDAEAGQSKAATCAACHGPDGNSPTPMYPKIAGQHAGYLVDQLKAYKSGARDDAVMRGMVAPLSEQDMKDIAAFYANQEIQPGIADESLVPAGEALYQGGNKETNIPACIACHGPSGHGIPSSGYPAIGGQHADYTRLQLEMYASGRRPDPTGVMSSIARRLSEADIRAVSSYVEGLHEREGAFGGED